MNRSLSDTEAEKMLRDSGLPFLYTKKERSIHEVESDDAGREYVSALLGYGIDDIDSNRGKVIQIQTADQRGMDAFYLTGRSLTLSGVGVGYMDLAEEIVDGEGKPTLDASRMMQRCRCIAISSMQSKHHPFPLSDRFAAYWERVIINKLHEGKSLLLQSEGPLVPNTRSKGWWSESFICTINNATILLTDFN